MHTEILKKKPEKGLLEWKDKDDKYLAVPSEGQEWGRAARPS